MKKYADILSKLKSYQFEFRHLTVLLVGLLVFQIILSSLQKSSMTSYLKVVQEWYQRDSAEKLANLAATSFELLIENIDINNRNISEREKKRIIQAFNIIFNQQLLQRNVQQICLLLPLDGKIEAIDNGAMLYDYLYGRNKTFRKSDVKYTGAIDLYLNKIKIINASEQTQSFYNKNKAFETVVPFVPHGEYLGVLYIKDNPDFTFFTREISSSYSQASVIYTTLIFLGLLSMYYISSYTVKERDKARRLFISEHERLLKEKIHREKESLFTKRIYHTYHKAEKIMGFIKEDVRIRASHNAETINLRLIKYANFISRVIYDMKWYDPPSNTIRGSMFVTEINGVIKFLVKNVFLRISSSVENIHFKLNLYPGSIEVNINEYVIWEILEPLIQNCIDHSETENLIISLETAYDAANKSASIVISDNGCGINDNLLKKDSSGVQKIFLESSTMSANAGENKGYGCYIAYELARNKCGWKIDARNLKPRGCSFSLSLKTI